MVTSIFEVTTTAAAARSSFMATRELDGIDRKAEEVELEMRRQWQQRASDSN